MRISNIVLRLRAAKLTLLAAVALVHIASAQTTSVHFSIDPSADRKPISPLIYGRDGMLGGAFANLTLERVGGNRLTAYNWVNNASNAGSDWHFQNDDNMGGGNTPGGAMIPPLQNAAANHAAIVLTIPTAGYVSADKAGDGDVRDVGGDKSKPDPDYLLKRFRVSKPAKNAPFSLAPAANGPVVFQDEFVNWVKTKFAGQFNDRTAPIIFDLDNEPDLWSETHAEIHPKPATYDEMVEKTIDYSTAIKRVMPTALIFGPVNYGWNGFITLQNPEEAKAKGDFQIYYLKQIAAAEKKSGKRLLDALDVHIYSEATGGGVRVTEKNNSPDVVAARLQATRSLWDPTYTETSWITKDSLREPLKLLPRLHEKIDQNDPAAKLAITEYNFGGGDHISGAIVQADVLGIFGRENVFAACQWPLNGDEPFVAAAFAMFRNFDGRGGAFGDMSIHAMTDNIADTSIYASVDASRMVLIAINKTDHPIDAALKIAGAKKFSRGQVFQLMGEDRKPKAAADLVIKPDAPPTYTLPPMSVSTIVLK